MVRATRSFRTRKVADRIKEVVAATCEGKIKDPRLGFVTITDVRVTGDLQSASIFYTVLGDEKERKNSAIALESAKGIIRATLGRELGLRVVPTVEFHLDALPESAATLDNLLAQSAARDLELDEQRSGADYAGESDPYRKPKQ
jgi:ribosome-binding factor A